MGIKKARKMNTQLGQALCVIEKEQVKPGLVREPRTRFMFNTSCTQGTEDFSFVHNQNCIDIPCLHQPFLLLWKTGARLIFVEASLFSLKTFLPLNVEIKSV